MTGWGLATQGEADGGKGSYCAEHLSSHQEQQMKCSRDHEVQQTETWLRT